MSSDNLENHMVLPGPWTGNPSDPSAPDATPEEIAAEEAAEREAAIEHEYDNWEKAIKTAPSGDVILWIDKDLWYTHILLVEQNCSESCGLVWGAGMVYDNKGTRILSVSTAEFAPTRYRFDKIANLQVISL